MRCPHLSQFLLSASVLSVDADKLLLQGLQPQLKQLQLLNAGCSPDPICSSSSVQGLHSEHIKQHVSGAPASWLLPVREVQPVSSAQIEWEVEVAEVRRIAQDSASQKKVTVLRSPTGCLLGGIMWNMQVHGFWDTSKQGSTVGLCACASNLPAGTACICSYNLSAMPSFTRWVPHLKRTFPCLAATGSVFGPNPTTGINNFERLA